MEGISIEEMANIIYERLKTVKEGDYISIGDTYYRAHYGLSYIEFIPEKPRYQHSMCDHENNLDLKEIIKMLGLEEEAKKEELYYE